MTQTFSLYFATGEQIQLVETRYSRGQEYPILKSVRGRTAGPFNGAGTFLWTSAVQAMSLLFVRMKLYATSNSLLPLIQGVRGSAAASLDMSISARTSWLAEMFGTDSKGGLIARRIFSRSNSSLKLPGPVSVGVNTRLIPAESILIWLDGVSADSKALELMATQLHETFGSCSTASSVGQRFAA